MFEFQSSAVRRNGGFWIRDFVFCMIHLVLFQKLNQGGYYWFDM